MRRRRGGHTEGSGDGKDGWRELGVWRRRWRADESPEMKGGMETSQGGVLITLFTSNSWHDEFSSLVAAIIASERKHKTFHYRRAT